MTILIKFMTCYLKIGTREELPKNYGTKVYIMIKQNQNKHQDTNHMINKMQITPKVKSQTLYKIISGLIILKYTYMMKTKNNTCKIL